MSSAPPTRNRPSRPPGFTLIELLTVAFIIAMMASLILPAIGHYRTRAQAEATRRYIMAITHGLGSYKQEFGDYPPSEPQCVDWNSGDVKAFNRGWRAVDKAFYDPSNDLLGFTGSAALLLYLNGRRSQRNEVTDLDGYSVLADTTTNRPDISETSQYYNASNVPGLSTYVRVWPPRVTGVPVSKRFRDAPRCGYVFSSGWRPGGSQFGRQLAGFLDRWGSEIEYFRAHRGGGQQTIDVFPRAVDPDFEYIFQQANPGVQNPPPDDMNLEARTVTGYGIHVPALRWLDADYSDYRDGWAERAMPINAGTFLLVSAGPDGVFGTEDDMGNW